ncbi:UNVERIFIED_CONTAM: hypothetical protein FKN15_067497 [Acipenser sinensis]
MEATSDSVLDWDHMTDLEDAQVLWYLQRLQGTTLEEEEEEEEAVWEDLDSEDIPAVLSPTYKQRNEDFRKLFKQLPDTERLIVDYSCALQKDILLQGRLYLSENWICFYSNIFRWETLLTVRLKDICYMTKEKTARLIPNAIQVCTDTEKHFFTSFGARDRTYMMMFRLWQNALLDKVPVHLAHVNPIGTPVTSSPPVLHTHTQPLCPKELWHFVHQCYGTELGLTSDDEDYVPPDDDFNTMGYCEEIPAEDNEVNDNSSKSSIEAKPDASPQLHKKSVTNSTLTSTGSSEALASFEGALVVEEDTDCQIDGDLLAPQINNDKLNDNDNSILVNSPSLDFNDNEDLPTELSDSSETHDEGEVQAFYDDLNGRVFINEVFKFSVDKMHSLLFTESQFMRDFLEQRRFSDMVYHPWKKEDNGNQTREIMYTITLTNPLAPKTATVNETQTLFTKLARSECYVIDAEVITHEVPYHDYFYTLNRYTLTRVAKNKCRLRVSTELRYRKQPWGLVKSFIEKNFWSGLDDYFRHLEMELTKAESLFTEHHRQSPKEKTTKTSSVRRRKRPLAHIRAQHLEEAISPVTTPTDEEVIHRIKHVAGSTQTKYIPEEGPGFALYSVSKILLIVSFVLVLLVFLNMMLFYKLWMLEYTTQSLTTWQGLRLHESKLPQSQMEWAQLLESQQRYHDAELLKWKEIIRSSVLLLDQPVLGVCRKRFEYATRVQQYSIIYGTVHTTTRSPYILLTVDLRFQTYTTYHEQALFNIQCQTVLLLDCIKHNCHCENEEEIDLADKSGQVKNLSQNERRYASEVLNEREELILISVSTTLGNKGDAKVTLNRSRPKKLSRKSPSSPSSPGADVNCFLVCLLIKNSSKNVE